MRSSRCSTALTALAVTFCASVCHADGTLTLVLPPSPAAQAARAAQKRNETRATLLPARGRASVLRGSRLTGSRAWRGGAHARAHSVPQRVVGRLGQLLIFSAIQRDPSGSSRVLYRAPAGTYLTIEGTAGAWYGVLMEDGSIGYLPRSRARLLAYRVVAKGILPQPSASSDGYPCTSTPFFTGDAEQLMQVAATYLRMHVPYKWGGNTASGIDCSGFVKKVFGALGFVLPRLGSDQMAIGIPVPEADLQAGDRLYFYPRPDGRTVKHTGIYIGNDLFIHSSTLGHGVGISSLTDLRYARAFVCARR